MNESNLEPTPEQLSDQLLAEDNLYYQMLFETTELEEVSVEFINEEEDD